MGAGRAVGVPPQALPPRSPPGPRPVSAPRASASCVGPRCSILRRSPCLLPRPAAPPSPPSGPALGGGHEGLSERRVARVAPSELGRGAGGGGRRARAGRRAGGEGRRGAGGPGGRLQGAPATRTRVTRGTRGCPRKPLARPQPRAGGRPSSGSHSGRTAPPRPAPPPTSRAPARMRRITVAPSRDARPRYKRLT